LCMDARTNVAARDRSVSKLWPIGAEAPHIAFRVGADELAAAIVAVGQSFHDGGAGLARPLEQRVRVIDGDVDRLAALAARLADKLAVFIRTALPAHDHCGAEGEFGVGDL